MCILVTLRNERSECLEGSCALPVGLVFAFQKDRYHAEWLFSVEIPTIFMRYFRCRFVRVVECASVGIALDSNSDGPANTSAGLSRVAVNGVSTI